MASSSVSHISSKHISCPYDAVLKNETLSGSKVRNSARKSVGILIVVFFVQKLFH